MALQYTVERGDSLWSLAQRYLGGGPRYPAIRKYHNEQAARFGPHGRLMSIIDDNLIYVGQTLMIPSREKIPAPGTGQVGTAKTLAREIDLKIKYCFGHGEEPIVYVQDSSDCIIKAEMSGEIGIELISPGRYRHNFEILMAKDAIQCKQKLNDIYSPAFSVLTARPDMVMKANQVTLTPRNLANANLKPYTINVSSIARNHMKGSLSAQQATGNLEFEGREFKYITELEFIVDVQMKSDKAVDQGQGKQGGYQSTLRKELAAVTTAVVRTFTDKELLKDFGRGFGQAGKIAALTHAAVAFKAYAIIDVATGGPVTTATMVTAGTPAGQKVLLEFIPSMNPVTLPSPTQYGFWGWLAGHLIEKKVRQN
jgi:hypothetical protein